MRIRKRIEGFLHYRTDLGDGIRTGVVFSDCSDECSAICSSYRFIDEHDFAEDTLERCEYSAEELVRYLLEEKTMYYSKKIGVTFLGKEPLRDPFFCREVACGLKKAGIGLQVYTCGMCSMTAFEQLDGLVELYVLRIFLPFDEKLSDSVFDRNKHVRQVLTFFENSHTPYRIMLILPDKCSVLHVDSFAEFALQLNLLKSVILNFGERKWSDSRRREIKNCFLNRKIPLY